MVGIEIQGLGGVSTLIQLSVAETFRTGAVTNV